MENIVYISELEEYNVDSELNDFIEENFASETKRQLKKAFFFMDKLGYGDYALDIYNFINLNTVNIDLDEAKLLFLDLVASHLVKLLESVGIIIEDDNLHNESYINHFRLLVDLTQALYMIKNMTELDAIYFADFINNEYLDKYQKFFRILEYYTGDKSYQDYINLVSDFKSDFLDILFTKIKDFANNADLTSYDYDEIDENLLIAKSEVITVLKDNIIHTITPFLSMLLMDININLLLESEDFLRNQIKEKESYLLNLINNVAYYKELDENTEVRINLFDLLLLRIIYNVKFEGNDIMEAISEAIDDTNTFFTDRDVTGLSVIKKLTSSLGKEFVEVFKDNDFANKFLSII
jgi:hypothetical protein